MSSFTAQLLTTLAQYPTPTRYWVAFSGGLDSTVLLHAMAACRGELPVDIAAVHIDHGLQAQSQSWQQHCQHICQQLSIPLTSLTVNVERQSGKGLEAAARAARYQAFASILQPGDTLCLAQHQDDQAETLMLQLLRGSGVAGLAAMPTGRPFAAGNLLRPLLSHTRSELRAYAEQHQLQWIEDPSNEHIAFDRNYLRHQVMSVLKQRWPSVDRSMARSASHLAEANCVLQEVAAQDWPNIMQGNDQQLSIPALQTLSLARQRNLLRYWIHHVNQAPLPDTKRLQQIFDEIIAATQDAEPCVQWQGIAIRRYRQSLYLTASELAAGEVHDWDLRQPLFVPELKLRLLLADDAGQQLDGALVGRADMHIGFRQGGEVCCPGGRGGQHHDLRKLWQEWGVPPWQRPRVPLLYVGDEIAAVIGYCVCEGYAARTAGSGIGIKIEDLSRDGIARQSENNDNIAD